MRPVDNRDGGRENWEGDDVPLGRVLRVDRRPLLDPLVRPTVVVVADVLGNDAVEVPVVEREDVTRMWSRSHGSP
jgi:hypothetical protein